MHLDNQAIFSDQQEVLATANSTNVLDLGEPGEVAYNYKAGAKPSLLRNVGKGMIIPLLAQVTEDFAGALTQVQFILQQDTTDDFSSGSVEDIVSVTVPVADLKAGYQLPIDKLPRGIDKRYLRMRYVLDAAATGGKITSGIVAAVDGAYVG